MKTYFILITASILIFGITVAGVLYSNSSPGAKTGSPLDGNTCIQCHSGTEIIPVNWISSNIPESGWVEGSTYTISLAAEHPTALKIGFELTAENASEKAGIFSIIDANKTKLVNKNSAVTHLSEGTTTSNGKNSWQVYWTAPKEKKGDITFYAAFNAANGNGSTSGDEIFTSAITYAKAETVTGITENSDILLKIFPNPGSDYVFIQSSEDITDVTFYKSNGSKAKSFKDINSKNLRVLLTDLNKGIYIAKVRTVKGEFNRRIQLK